jgi:hypothetical protein
MTPTNLANYPKDTKPSLTVGMISEQRRRDA